MSAMMAAINSTAAITITAIAHPGSFFWLEFVLDVADGDDVGDAEVDVGDCAVVLREISKKINNLTGFKRRFYEYYSYGLK